MKQNWLLGSIPEECNKKLAEGREVTGTSRIALSPEQKNEYMIADLPFLFEKEARKRGLCQKDLAKALRISPQAYNARKKRKRDGKPKDVFRYGEMLILFRLLEMSEDEILKLFRK